MGSTTREYGKTGRHSRRPRPSAWALDATSLTQDQKRYGRTVYLRTGRGAVSLTPEEARDLAAELIAAATGSFTQQEQS
jgi:hypothetical protein